MAYASPNTINSSEGIGAMLNYINTITNFWAGRMIMIAVFVLFLVGYIRSKADEDFIGAFAVASYVTFVIGLLFWLINFLDGISFSIIIGTTIVATALLLFDKRGNN